LYIYISVSSVNHHSTTHTNHHTTTPQYSIQRQPSTKNSSNRQVNTNIMKFEIILWKVLFNTVTNRIEKRASSNNMGVGDWRERERKNRIQLGNFFPHTQSGWEREKNYCNNFIPDFVPICWVKDIDLMTVSVLEIRWRWKCETPRGLYSKNPMSPFYLLWDSSCKLFIYRGTHPPELINYRPNSYT
jgi:hypothetical protein